jgi:hypothetical protein
MHIHCVSSLADDDEEVLAPALVALLASFFDELSVTYAIQAKTADAKVCRCSRPPVPNAARHAACSEWEGGVPPDDLETLNLSKRLPS